MATTKGKLTEVCKRLIKGGNPSSSSSVWDEEIWQAIGQVINKLLKTDYFGVNLPAGETIPSGYILATYDGIKTEAWKDRSRAKLPIIPALLPRNMGVFHVGPADDPDCFYIPLPAGQGLFVKSQQVISELLCPACYEQKDGYVIFDRRLPGLPDVSMQLVVMDIDHYGEYDLLPIPADMEKDVVDEVVARFSKAPMADKIVDSNTEPTKLFNK